MDAINASTAADANGDDAGVDDDDEDEAAAHGCVYVGGDGELIDNDDSIDDDSRNG
jgi:hypothetical protein